MVTHLDVKESIEDKQSWFNIKRFNFRSIKSEGPIKTFDLNHVSQSQVSKLPSKNLVLEKSKIVKNADAINEIINTRDDSQIASFFGVPRWATEHFSVIPMTFKFNPYTSFKKFDTLAPFFNYYYQYSKDMLFVPNIKMSKFDPETKKSFDIATLDEYKKFVDETYSYLDTKNNKPIFVPLSVRLSLNDIIDLLNHYAKQERTHLWMDFEGKPVNETIMARINQVNRILKDKKIFEKTILYATNIRREITSNKNEDKSPASDVLAPISGANFVGVNREPARFFGDAVTPAVVEHKARVFNPATYYYLKTKAQSLSDQHLNAVENATRLYHEFEAQTTQFSAEYDLRPYLRTKEMLTNHNNGQVLDFLTKKSSPKTLASWF